MSRYALLDSLIPSRLSSNNIASSPQLLTPPSQEWIKHTVWKDSCRSWYKNNATGRVNAIHPGSSLHYMKLIAAPR